jgi:hypothetical protein
MAGSATLAAADRSAGCERSADEARCCPPFVGGASGPRPDLFSRPSSLSGAPGAAFGRSGGMHSSPMAGSRGPGPAWHCARVGDPRPRAGSPAVMSTYQRGKQARPLRPVRPALGRGGWPPNRGPHGLVRTAGWPAATGGTGFSSGNPPRRRRAVTPAGRACQPAQRVLRPARSDGSGPVVRLPERGRIRESRLAPRHGTPGGRNPDLVTNDTVPGDRNRMNQRIQAHRRLPGFTITVSQDADRRRLSSAASPSGYARPPGVPGETS